MAREITATTRALPRLEEREVKIISLKRIVFLRFIRHKMAVFGTLVVLFMPGGIVQAWHALRARFA